MGLIFDIIELVVTIIDCWKQANQPAKVTFTRKPAIKSRPISLPKTLAMKVSPAAPLSTRLANAQAAIEQLRWKYEQLNQVANQPAGDDPAIRRLQSAMRPIEDHI